MDEHQTKVLAHVVVDPDAWYASAVASMGEHDAQSALIAKVARHEAAYIAALEAEGNGYKPRAQREEE